MYRALRLKKGERYFLRTVVQEARCKMSKKMKGSAIVLAVLLLAGVFFLSAFEVSADPSASAISGRLAATFNKETGTVTALVAGYCEGKPVMIGPQTWAMAEREFSSLNAEDIGKVLCGNQLAITKVVKSSNDGKAIVAEVVLTKPKTAAPKDK
jgi:hypothetical protein